MKCIELTPYLQVNPFHKWGWPVKLMFGDIDWSSVILEMFADSRKLDKLFLDGNQNPDFITGVGELKLRRVRFLKKL